MCASAAARSGIANLKRLGETGQGMETSPGQRPLRTRDGKPACTERPGGTSLGMEASQKEENPPTC